MLRVAQTVILLVIAANAGWATPEPGPTRAAREAALDVLLRCGAHVMVFQAGRKVEVWGNAQLYLSFVADAGIADGRPLVSHPMLQVFLASSDTTKDWGEALKALSSFPELEVLTITGGHITSAGAKRLAALRKLRELMIQSTGITDDDMRCVRAMPELRLLQVLETKLTGSCMHFLPTAKHLERLELIGDRPLDASCLGCLSDLKSLRFLYLGFSQVDGAGLLPLARLTQLETLSLYIFPAGITDADLKQLVCLKNLRSLYVDGAKVTGNGIAQLRQLTNLEILSARSKTLVDADMTVMRQFHSLQGLDLTGTKITDAGLKPFYGMRALKELTLRDTAVTAAGLRALRAARPTLKIWWSGSGSEFPGRVGATLPPPRKTRATVPRD